MVSKLKALFAIICLILSIGAFPSSGRFNVNQGPCDIVVCAEAYSVTRGLKATYLGPLFQISNGSSTLDIGQVNHKADMSTWSAFCSGVQSNCTIKKVYAQIQGHANDLQPFTPASPAVFQIEAATGLPLLFGNDTAIGFPAVQQYAIGGPSDNAATGINAGGAAESVIYNGINIAVASCCGIFGTTHLYSTPNVGTVDFSIGLLYGPGVSGFGACATNTVFCLGVDEEGGEDRNAEYAASSPLNVIAAIAYDPVPNRITGYINNNQLINNSPPNNGTPLNSGLRVHFAGGGDMSGPAPAKAREMIITNTAISSAQMSTVFNNMTAFYSALTFISGPTGGTFAGVADVKSAPLVYWGTRAVSAAVAAAGTQRLFQLTNTVNSHTCDIIVATNGGLGLTANCSSSPDNGKTARAFCYLITSGIEANNCGVSKLYNQGSLGVADLVQAIIANMPRLVLNCVHFMPCISFDTAGPQGISGLTGGATSQPYTITLVAQQNVSGSGGEPWTAVGSLYMHYTATNTYSLATNTGGTFPAISATESDFLFHAIQNLLNGGSSSIFLDGVTTSGTLGADAYGGGAAEEFGINEFGERFTGMVSELGIWGSAFSGTDKTNMNANQRAYWGF